MGARLRQSTLGMVILALFAAPCVGGLALTPIGLGAAFMASGLFVFLDDYRLITMAAPLVLLGVTLGECRRTGRAIPLYVTLSIIVILGLITAELIVDPPWVRHALVPM